MFDNALLLKAYQEERERQVRKLVRQRQLLTEVRRSQPRRGVGSRLRFATGSLLIGAGHILQSQTWRETTNHG